MKDRQLNKKARSNKNLNGSEIVKQTYVSFSLTKRQASQNWLGWNPWFNCLLLFTQIDNLELLPFVDAPFLCYFNNVLTVLQRCSLIYHGALCLKKVISMAWLFGFVAFLSLDSAFCNISWNSTLKNWTKNWLSSKLQITMLCNYDTCQKEKTKQNHLCIAKWRKEQWCSVSFWQFTYWYSNI